MQTLPMILAFLGLAILIAMVWVSIAAGVWKRISTPQYSKNFIGGDYFTEL